MAQSSKHFRNGAVVVIPIIGQTETLLIKEPTKPKPHFWKFVAETLEPGEPVLNALVGGAREEAGLTLEARYNDRGEVSQVTDLRVKLKRLGKPERVNSHFPHTRHVLALFVSDELIHSLSGKTLQGDKNETLMTQAFPLSELMRMTDFNPGQRELLKLIPR